MLCVAVIYAEPIYYRVNNIFQEWFIWLVLEAALNLVISIDVAIHSH